MDACTFCHKTLTLQRRGYQVCYDCSANLPYEDIKGLSEEPSPYYHDRNECQPELCSYCWQEGREDYGTINL